MSAWRGVHRAAAAGLWYRDHLVHQELPVIRFALASLSLVGFLGCVVPAAAPVQGPPPSTDEEGTSDVPQRGTDGQHCAGGACVFSCPEGNCAYVCEAGSTCNIECPGGNCSTTCQGGSTCNQDCDGGNCALSCTSGSTCNQACDGGNCRTACDQDTVCAAECNGGNCS